MDQVFLYIVIFWWGDKSVHRTPMPSLEECYKAVAVVKYQGSDGAENESGIAAWCGSKDERSYSGTWWVDPIKEH